MTDDVVRRYYSARPIQAPAQLLADAIHEVEILREKLARYKLTHEQYVEAIDRINGTPCEQIRHQQEVEALREEIARLQEGKKDD